MQNLNLGMAIQTRRELCGLTRSQVAKKASIPAQSFYKVETNRVGPSHLRMVAIAEVLETTPAQLIRDASLFPPAAKKVIRHVLLMTFGSSANGFGERVRLARERKGMTGADLHRVVGISICHYERYARVPAYPIAKRIADALGTTVTWLCTGTDDGVAA